MCIMRKLSQSLFCLILVLFIVGGCTKQRPLSKEELFRIHQQLYNDWINLRYFEISDDEDFSKYVSSSILRNSDAEGAELSFQQKQELVKRITSFFLAFNLGSEDVYRNFITPKNLHWTMTPKLISLITSYTNGANLTYEGCFSLYLKSISGQNYYKNFWNGVCLNPKDIQNKLGSDENLPIKYGITIQKNSIFNIYKYDAEEVMKQMSHNTFWSTFYTENNFSEKEGVLETYRKTNSLLLANVFCFIKRRSPFAPIPLITQFYWNESGKTWIPRGYIIGYIAGIEDFKNFETVELF